MVTAAAKVVDLATTLGETVLETVETEPESRWLMTWVLMVMMAEPKRALEMLQHELIKCQCHIRQIYNNK